MALSKAVKKTIIEALDSLPDKVADRVVKFVVASHPCYSDNKSLPSTPSGSAGSPTQYMDVPLNLHGARPEVIAGEMQKFLEGIYDELLVHYTALAAALESPSALHSLRRKGSVKGKGVTSAGAATGGGEENEKAGEDGKATKEKKKAAAEAAAEKQAMMGVDLVEGVVCGIFYNE